jgi:SAM-dependent methyltransferase
MEKPEIAKVPPGMEMYFDRKLAEEFAELEQNEKHKSVARVLDRVALHELKEMPNPLHVAELGGGAHPDRYDGIYARLLEEPRGQMDWVDISPYMLEFAENYLDEQGLSKRKEVTRFIRQDLMEYLQRQSDHSLDLVLLKYVAAYLPPTDFASMTALLSKKLKRGGCMVATYNYLKPELPSRSTNTKYFLNGESVPEGVTQELHHGDKIGIKFFKISGNPDSGFLEGAESLHYYHAPDWIRQMAEQNQLDCFLGDWSERVPAAERGEESMVQAVVVFRA